MHSNFSMERSIRCVFAHATSHQPHASAFACVYEFVWLSRALDQPVHCTSAWRCVHERHVTCSQQHNYTRYCYTYECRYESEPNVLVILDGNVIEFLKLKLLPAISFRPWYSFNLFLCTYDNHSSQE